MKKIFILLLAGLGVLTACSQQTNETNAGSSSASSSSSVSSDSSVAAESVTKTYQLNKVIEGLNQTMLLTITYRGEDYERVNLHFSQNMEEDIKERFASQDLDSLKGELLPSIEQATGVDKLAEVRGVEVKTDLTKEGTVEIDLAIDPANLDYEAAVKVPDYSDIFETMQSSKPEEFIDSFKADGATEVPNP